ncbi:sulfite reductase flavoprotein subunit alpha [Mycolicibacterium fluoranthenivorans]|uniref:assimilatory sulfite reductase (NADPH) n=1 Tax=Mycolicibacterium fluoranthenivorans TaxID=258505 RepID=A0A7G8PMH3_9MYCO|nr:sulfite reductase flavoprotein subunit alpha [Mycolicibacterium fluoranthenivorans]QNJ95539.1 sulfite reductase flavoprotein subunit alpha [Mycolicibacterium fluoranthenivorans]
MTGTAEISMIVAFGTDMGNAEDAAMTFAESVAPLGIQAEAIELNQVEVSELQTATHFLAVVSTFGEGDFPDSATLFWEALESSSERLENLSFSVLALGDSSYEFFCNAGKLLDAKLEQLGATRIVDRVDVDGFYEQPAKAWTADVVKILTAERGATAPTEAVAAPAAARERHEEFEAALVVNRLLTASESDKEVRHYEVDLAGLGLTYQAGDSLAVHATNDPALVALILAELGVGPDHLVPDHDEPLGVLLTERLEIRTPSRALQDVAGPAAYGEDVLDLIKRAGLKTEEVLDTLRPLGFRDYSIASSPLVHPERIHLTVASVRYPGADRDHSGVASTFLADRADRVRVHLRPNHNFRLPAPDVPIIMIGPGTGIAPFRAFLQEREATGATGRAWLFFGDRRRATDYLYGAELEDFLESGALTRLDLAFSRDQDAKVYVQHRMSENAEEFFSWLADGAYVYVCGDADRMAKDVDATLHEVVARGGGMDADAAHTYVNDLVKSHRYVRDVY